MELITLTTGSSRYENRNCFAECLHKQLDRVSHYSSSVGGNVSTACREKTRGVGKTLIMMLPKGGISSPSKEKDATLQAL